MKSSVTLTNSLLKNQWGDGFPLPKPDTFGICNNFKSAHFFMDDQSACAQMVNLATDCENVLNAEFFSTSLSFLKGQSGKDIDKNNVGRGGKEKECRDREREW